MSKNWKIARNIFFACGPTIIMGGIILIVGLHIIANALSEIGYNGGCLDWWGGSDDPSAIETGGNLSLPLSADNLFAHSIAFQDCTVFISFEMNPAELDTFIDSTYVTALTPLQGNRLWEFKSMLNNSIPDWQFADDTTYLYGAGSNGNEEAQYLVIDPNADRYKVYVISLLL